MRAQAQQLPNVRWLKGTAEKIPLADKSVDVAAAFQSFHWFDVQKAFAEFERIARRRIGLLQYERDESQAFAGAYAAIVRRYATDDTEALRMRALEQFSRLAGERVRRAAFPFTQRLDSAGILGRVASSSYLPSDGTQGEQLRSEMHDLFDRFQNGGFVDMAMQVYVLTVDL